MPSPLLPPTTCAPQNTPACQPHAQLPAEPAELIADLTTKFKLRSALASVASTRKPIALLKAEKPKKKRKLNIRHITNTHMAHVLTDNQFTSIDH